MSVEVVTSFSLDGYITYGQEFIASYAGNWAHPLTVYLDTPIPLDVNTRLTSQMHGWVGTRGRLRSGNPRALEKSDSYLWNARRYAVKPFIWHDAAKRMDSGILCWLDADTVTTGPVPAGILEEMLGKHDVAYLGRGAMHPENGCVVFRLPQAMPLLNWCRSAYMGRGFYRYWKDGWTDCHALRRGLRSSRVRSRDLTSCKHSGQWRSHVDAFALSPLGPYVKHLKGNRQKREGRLIPLDEYKESYRLES